MQENFILTKLTKTDVLSVFLAYHDSLNCVYDIGLAENASSQQKFDRYDELENGVVSVQEHLTNAEKYIEIIKDFSESPEKFTDLAHYPQQITYKDIESLTDNFSTFLEDLNKAYDNFFEFFVSSLFQFIDKNKSYKVYREYKPKGKSTPNDIQMKKEVFYSLLKDVRKDTFNTNFTELTHLYFDINKKRNAINHGGKTKFDLLKGHYTVSVDDNRNLSVRTFPVVDFHDEQVSLDVFSKYAFNKIFYSIQNLYAACINTVLQEKPKTAGLDICPQLYPIEILDDVLKNKLEQSGKIHSEKQAYVFGLVGENNEFINFSCSRPQDPKFINKLMQKEK